MTTSREMSLALSHRSGRHLKLLIAMVLTIATLLTMLGGTRMAWADDSPQLTVTALSPEVYSGTGDVTVGLQLTDPTLASSGVTDIEVETFLQPTPFISVEAFQSFLSGAGFPGWRLNSENISTASLGVDGSFAVTISGDQLPWLDPQTTGSRGLTVQVTVGDQTVEARTALIYQPVGQDVQTNVNLTAFTPVEADFFADFGNITDQKNQQSEAKTTEALAQINGVSLAVLPGFFTGLDRRSSVRQVYPRFKEYQDQILAQGVELVSLPAQNADLSLLGATSQSALLQIAGDSRTQTDTLTDPAWTQGSATALDGIIFASNEGFTRASLSSLSETWPGTVVISPSGWSADPSVDSTGGKGAATEMTPTALLQIDPHTGLLWDASGASTSDSTDQPVTVIDQWSFVSDLLNRPVGSDSAELQIRQTLRTATLLVGLEDPSDQRTLFTTVHVSRETSGDALVARAQALLQPSWVNPVPLSEVIASPVSEINRAPVPDSTPGSDPTLHEAALQFDRLTQEYERAQSVQASSSVSQPLLLNPYLPSLLAPTETGLAAADRQKLSTQAVEKLRNLTEVVDVLPISQLNIVNTTSDFLVSVRNSGQIPLSVVVSLFPSDPRLQSAKPAETVIPANSMVGVAIPVKAVGSGDIDVRVQVTTLDGTILDDSQVVPVRVRANWEDTGTIIVGSLLALLFFFGIIRTIRKGRRRRKSPDVEGPDGTPPATPAHIFQSTQGGEA